MTHIPFRESKLTRLLAESFSGGGKTVLITTASPGSDATQETLATLKCTALARNLELKLKKAGELADRKLEIESPHPVVSFHCKSLWGILLFV